MTPRAVVALGIGQCVNWGVLYYAFAVLVLPLERELGVATWVVTGAFSLALLMSAALAPAIGRWGDRDRGALVMQAGGVIAAALLAASTFMPGVLTMYVVWAGLGLCMAATLYEPAFAIVGRAHDDPARRRRALAAVTLFGGLASTVFLPLTALLVAAAGWRGAVLVLAALLVVSTSITRAFVFRHLPAAAPTPVAGHSAPRVPDGSTCPARFLLIAAMFALTSLASAAFATNLVPALGERGVSPATAATLGGLIGVMQLPGRALLMNGILALPRSRARPAGGQDEPATRSPAPGAAHSVRCPSWPRRGRQERQGGGIARPHRSSSRADAPGRSCSGPQRGDAHSPAPGQPAPGCA
jgi:MFS family permease